MAEEQATTEGSQDNTATSEGEKAQDASAGTMLGGGDKGVEDGGTMLNGKDSSEEGEGEEKKETEAKVNAPEEYKDFELPEGVSFDEEPLRDFKEMAKGLDLSQESAQKLVGFYLAEQGRVQGQKDQEWLDQRKTWKQDLRADNEFGGNKFNQTLERANRVLRRFGESETIGFLDKSGLGDYPGMVRLLAKIDLAISEDKLVEGKPGTSKELTMAETLYPGSNNK